MFSELTTQQFCALDYMRNIVVTAGPGAGKTKILSHRYCFILLTDDDVSIPDILTLTFTEKAAEEMKTRIYQILLDLETDPAGYDSSICKDKLKAAREEFHRNRISTIHSFCAGLLKEYPVEAGIDPGFNIIQGIRQKEVLEESIERAVSSAWRHEKDMVTTLLNSFGSRRFLINGIRDLTGHPVTFQRVLASAENLFGKENWMESVFRDYCLSIMERFIVPYYHGLQRMGEGKGQYDELMENFNAWSRDSDKEKEHFGIPALFRKMRCLAEKRSSYSPRLAVKNGLESLSYVDLIGRYYPDLFVMNNPDNLFSEELRLFLRIAESCLKEYEKEKDKLNSMDFNDLETRSYQFLKGLMLNDRDSLNGIQESFKHVMVDEFQDTNRIQWDIIKLLCVDTEKDQIRPGKLFVVGDKRQAIYRFRGGDVTVFEEVTKQIKESNGSVTAPMFWQQKKTVAVICELFKGSEPEIKKQSEAFESLPSEEKNNILKGDIYLPHNFRSDERLISFFNGAFKEIFGNRGAEDVRDYETPPGFIVLPDFKKNQPENRGSAAFYLSDSSLSSGKDKKFEDEASLIADIIEGILGRKGKDNYEYRAYPDIREKINKNMQAIGILFFTFTHLKVYENVLRDSGIPFSVHRGRGFYRCQEVMDILQLLNYIVDTRQQISLLSVLRSPIFGITDPELFDVFYGGNVSTADLLLSQNPYLKKTGRKLDYLRALSARLTIPEMIRTIVSLCSLTAVYSAHPQGVRKLANIDKLVEISRDFQMGNNGSLYDFVKYGISMAEGEEEEGEALINAEEAEPVSLMTIHSAKGLEFPMVILPDLDRKPPLRTGNGKPLRLYKSQDRDLQKWNHEEGEIPVWPVEIAGLNYLKKMSPLGYLLRRRDNLEDMAENRRVFYVGCTRAKNHLILPGRVKKKDEKEQELLTSKDYREKAAIQDLLNDIYGLDGDTLSLEETWCEANESNPEAVWYEPQKRVFKGTEYSKERPDFSALGRYDDIPPGEDLSGPVKAAPYYQISFTSVQTFFKCPVRFYYDVILGLKAKYFQCGILQEDASVDEDAFEYEDSYEYSSEEALFLGNFIHAYLEKYDFEGPLNEGLFNRLWEFKKLPDKDLSDLKEKAFNHLTGMANDRMLADIIKNKKSCSEVPFRIKVKDGVEFRGVIDRLFKDEETGSWSIIDWKSNDLESRNPEDVIKESNYDMQLAFYRWAAEKLLKEQVENQYIYFTDRSMLVRVDWKGDPVKVIEDILAGVERYEKDSTEWNKELRAVKEDGAVCRFCEFRFMKGAQCREVF